MEKACGICSNKFRCGGIFCWCKNIKLNRKSLETLKLLSDGCVCPSCLENLKNNE